MDIDNLVKSNLDGIDKLVTMNGSFDEKIKYLEELHDAFYKNIGDAKKKCECGKTVKVKNYDRHILSKYHLAHMSS